MAIEIEKKYRLTQVQFAKIKETLEDLEAEYIGEDFEENLIYGGGILQEINAVLRIRKTGSKKILTFKKRMVGSSGIKEQIEHETEVENDSEMRKIIGYLGFELRLVYEKRRKKWKLKNTEVVLDELPFGLFMEIEGSAEEIREAELILEAEDFQTEHKTYPNLTAESGKKNGEVIEARF